MRKRITELWHRLLIRNADYAREATLWQVRSEPIQPYLEPGTLLLEYYCIHGQFVAFLVTSDSVSSRRLDISISQVQQLLQLLWLNLRSVPRSPAARVELLKKNALGILARLYQSLVAPLESEIRAADRLVIVPHNALHYIPFQALYDGEAYLCERQEISYLPGANVLRYCQQDPPPATGSNPASSCNLLAVGHSYQGRLPFTLQEAEMIAGMWNGQTLLEDQATLGELRRRALDCRILHLAAHGDFRPDNPLFSGLALADGWLTTLDIFNLRLSSALVTLSACQSGRSVVGGGDELLGLMRSFLAAGASALVSTLWAVEDRSTAPVDGQFLQLSFPRPAQGRRPAPGAAGPDARSTRRCLPAPLFLGTLFPGGKRRSALISHPLPARLFSNMREERTNEYDCRLVLALPPIYFVHPGLAVILYLIWTYINRRFPFEPRTFPPAEYYIQKQIILTGPERLMDNLAERISSGLLVHLVRLDRLRFSELGDGVHNCPGLPHSDAPGELVIDLYRIGGLFANVANAIRTINRILGDRPAWLSKTPTG